MSDTIILKSTITCPVCGHVKAEIMPADACQYFYECENCKTILKPLAGDCCVFCNVLLHPFYFIRPASQPLSGPFQCCT